MIFYLSLLCFLIYNYPIEFLSTGGIHGAIRIQNMNFQSNLISFDWDLYISWSY